MVNLMNHDYVLPLIDISLLNSASLEDRKQVVKQLDQACKDVGFLYIQGEQFQPELFDQLKQTAQQYFNQDHTTKMQHYIGLSENHSGYVPIGEEQFKANVYDLKESYDINYDYLGELHRRPLLGPTLWPEDAHFKHTVLNYYQHIKAIGNQLFKAFALALDLNEDFFEPNLKHAPSQLRLIHYPYNPEAEDQSGIGAHTDYECFTLLFPTAEGLQVLNKQGEWIDIPLIENTMVMNIGDMMEILSNGRYLATKHRVRRVQQERYSFPLFFSCDYDYLIQPLILNEAPLYPPMKGGEHLFNQTAQTFMYLKQRIQSGELVLENARPLYSFGLNEQGASE
ncbi:isopenicillin N synthase family dioxygenase [Acinetobacter dispersus]|uniref:isopenicillin N synthase family dioxygenase n=1 Tax=Acinetobacter dispersus TaxID=70348 RepID=UPI003C3048D5